LANLPIALEFYDKPLEPTIELQRMEHVAENKETIGGPLAKTELAPGQTMYFSSRASFPDQLWSQFQQRTKLAYVFALITYTDELSGEHEITKEACVHGILI